MISDATPLAANAHLTFILESCFTCAREWDFSDYKWMVKCLCACFVTGCSYIGFFLFFFMLVKYTATLRLICAFSSARACVCVSAHFIVGRHHQNLGESVLGVWYRRVCESMRENLCASCACRNLRNVCSCVKVHLNSMCEVCVWTCFSSHKCVKVRSSPCVWRCVEGVLNFRCMWKYGGVKVRWSSCTCGSMCVWIKFMLMWKYVCVKVSSCTCESMCVWR